MWYPADEMSRSTILVVSVVLLACKARGGGSKDPSSDPCADFEVEVEKFWSASVKAKVMQYGGEASTSVALGVTNKMDRITEDWVMLRTSTCKDHFARKLITADDYRAKVACFDAQLAKQRTLAETLGTGALADADAELDTLLAEPAQCR